MISKGLLKSALVIVSALLMVSVVCPLGSCTVADGVLEQLSELKEVIGDVVVNHPTIYTDTNTLQQMNALHNKIDAVMKMVEKGNYMGAAKKLERDIAPKFIICNTSWLSDDPELRDVVEEFSGMCQEMINGILIALHRLING